MAAVVQKTDPGPSTAELVASTWIRDAEAILICAGAGMSIHEEGGFRGNIYIDPAHFEEHYPGLVQLGYHTAYESMGLSRDSRVPIEVRKGYLIQHMNNMAFVIPPTPGHEVLLELCKQKGEENYFVWTSNVDNCFERSGFHADRIYTPQGRFSFMQCLQPGCRAVWDAKAVIDEVLPNVDPHTSRIRDPSKVPTCPKCGSVNTMGNVRGGPWFVHDHYQASQQRVIDWLETQKKFNRKLVVIEIGAGFNTPTVTRWPMESIVREFSESSLIRINPTNAEVPPDLPRAIGFATGWQILHRLKEISLSSTIRQMQQEMEGLQEGSGRNVDQNVHGIRCGRIREMDWRTSLAQLAS